MDINADGFADIFSGCYSQRGHDGMVGSFWVLYGDKEGNFAKPVELMGTDGKLLCVTPDFDESRRRENICTRPFAVDWDGDKDLDIVAGNFEGTFFVFTGEGNGKFAPKAEKLLDKDGKALKISGVHSDPNILDWDGDGDLDLITGSSDGKVYWAENVRSHDEKVTGADRTPELTALKLLIDTPKKGPAYGIRINVADVNGDGKLDIFVGDRASSGGGMRDDMTDEEKAEYEKLEKENEKIMADYMAIWDGYMEDYNAALEKAKKEAGGEISEEEQRKLYKELVTDKFKADDKMKDMQTKMRAMNEKLAKYKVPYVSKGTVWVYEQQ